MAASPHSVSEAFCSISSSHLASNKVKEGLHKVLRVSLGELADGDTDTVLWSASTISRAVLGLWETQTPYHTQFQTNRCNCVSTAFAQQKLQDIHLLNKRRHSAIALKMPVIIFNISLFYGLGNQFEI